MSGRKSSEVLDLLSNSNEIRDKVLRNAFKNIEELTKRNIEIIKKFSEIKRELALNSLTLSDEVKKKYVEELKRLEILVAKIRNYENVNLNDLIVESRELENIKHIFVEIDIEADRLRSLVRGKSHYCDNEYRLASELVNKARNAQTNVGIIEKRIEDKVRENLGKYAEGESLKEIKKEIAVQYKNMEERHLADNNREQLKRELEEIEVEWAEKLVNEEYRDLKEEIETILEEDDTQKINNNSTQLFNKINFVKNLLIERREVYELKKQQVEREIEEIQKKLSDISFGDIEQNLIDDSDTQIGLFEFEKRYCKTSNEKEYIEITEKINNFYKREEFDNAIEKLKEMRDKVEDFKNFATKQYERLLKEQEIVRKIVGAVYELGYDISVNCLDDDIRNGYTIEAVAGDEIINFDKISVDENGNITIDLDHKESVTGSCGDTMKNLMSAMQDQGIFITDILKNGNSVIFGDKNRKSENITKNIASTSTN